MRCANRRLASGGIAWSFLAADVDPAQAKVMYAVSNPWAAPPSMGAPAGKSLPSWYLVTQTMIKTAAAAVPIAT